MINQNKLIKISQKTNGRCFYCNKDGEQVDHFISKKKWKEWGLTEVMGDVDNLTNLFLACRKCNISKLDKCPEDFMRDKNKNYSEYRNTKICWDRYEKTNRRITKMSKRMKKMEKMERMERADRMI